MLTAIEAQRIENEFLENVASAAGRGGVLTAHYKQKLLDEQVAHQQTRDELTAAQSEIKDLKEYIGQLEREREALKMSQTNYIFNEGAVHNDNSQNIQLLGGSTMPMLGAVL